MYFFVDFRSVLIFLGQILVLFYVIFITKNWRYFKFAWHNNGFFLPMLPFLGTLYIALISGTLKNIVAMVIYAEKVMALPFNIWVGHDYHYITADPNEAKILLNNLNCQNKGSVYQNIAYLLEDCLLTVDYNKWKIRRKEYAKCFKPSGLKVFSLKCYKGTCDFIKEMLKQNGEKSLTYDDFIKYSFINYFLTSLGLDKKPEIIHRYVKFLIEFQEDIAEKMLNPTPLAIWYYLTSSGRNTARHYREINYIGRKIYLNKLKPSTDFKEFFTKEDNPLLLDVMMSQQGKILNEKIMLDDLAMFPLASSDTTSHVFMMSFTLIGMFPDVQENIYQEIINLVGQRPITPDDVLKLEYTKAVIFESLRLFPAVPILTRKLSKDIDLGTKIVPKGANIGVSIFHLQRNPKYWPNPLKFDPARFLPENASNLQPNTYLPFSSGPRDCIGKAQAICLLKITIASVVRDFKIYSKHKSIEEFKITSSLTMKTSNSLDCHFIPRTENVSL